MGEGGAVGRETRGALRTDGTNGTYGTNVIRSGVARAPIPRPFALSRHRSFGPFRRQMP